MTNLTPLRNFINEPHCDIDWDDVFKIRNHLNDLHFNRMNPNFVDWNQDVENIENELVITP